MKTTIEPTSTKAGVGLRFQHLDIFPELQPAVGFLEVHSENCGGPINLKKLGKLREIYPFSLHGVGLSLGTTDELRKDHIALLKSLVQRLDPFLISEHLSWSSVDGTYFNDLLPLPYTDETLTLFCNHVSETQDALGQEILIENPSSYLTFKQDTYAEPQFLKEIVDKTGCKLLLDVNNVYVSGKNHDFDPDEYIDSFSHKDVREIHLAGHSCQEIQGTTLRIDTHSDFVLPEVWELYEKTLKLCGPTPTLIEWDLDIPELPVLVAEAHKADEHAQKALKEHTSEHAA
ncbi:MAG: DUF692 domain-containing protein [Alphaproteobacteria bacterium]|jgi:uncharacterized protein|nr:DUF692 domain-containing protein [Alphaproteobacteria bacterium]MBT5389978.1 DUF692 domain-containing protein [Alphaproteobacteria bacterium]MBT5541070.1 DUF692 domain-containing protein [Alphaproteobacteria bacterium]MBT5654219.1 DUF692 domain-containing protein [Alphaproteobacteria bacterium]